MPPYCLELQLLLRDYILFRSLRLTLRLLIRYFCHIRWFVLMALESFMMRASLLVDSYFKSAELSGFRMALDGLTSRRRSENLRSFFLGLEAPVKGANNKNARRNRLETLNSRGTLSPFMGN
jgi:hypothetical protein